ncbi:MAG: type II secretion system F family protein [Thermoguttaceae bacterium]
MTLLAAFFAPRIGLKPLVDLCRRLSTATGAGIDTRTVWTREADRAVGPLRRRLLSVSRAIHAGNTLPEALAETGDYFPPLFRELIDVGEQSGNLDRILAQLASHYESRLSTRRTFLTAISPALIQLTLALGVIALGIWLTGVLNLKTDIYGLGLVGTSGLFKYVTFLAAVGAVVWILLRAVNRGVFWVKPVQRLVLRVPVVGKALETIALSRLAWSMHLTMNTGMDLRRAMKLSLRSTQNAHYIGQIPAIDAEIERGTSIHEAFCTAGGYPTDFLDTLAVGEESGQVVESMGRLAKQYQERARAALVVLTTVAAWLVWAAIAAMIIVMVLRVFVQAYLGPIKELLPK